mgnify:CR=1 FL=1
MPIVFKPVRIDGANYVDGGVLHNLPSWAIRDECEYLIGVNVSPLVKARHMIGHKVDYHPHAGIMRSDKKRLEFLHASIDIDRYVGIYIIVVLYE